MSQKHSEAIIPSLTATGCLCYCRNDSSDDGLLLYHMYFLYNEETNSIHHTAHFFALICLGRKDFKIKIWSNKYNLKTNNLKWLVYFFLKIPPSHHKIILIRNNSKLKNSGTPILTRHNFWQFFQKLCLVRLYTFCFLMIDPTEYRPHTLMSSSAGYNIPISNLGLSL